MLNVVAPLVMEPTNLRILARSLNSSPGLNVRVVSFYKVEL